MAMPALHRLRLGADTGLQLHLVQDGALNDAALGLLVNCNPLPPPDGPGRPGAAPGQPRLKKLIEDLKSDRNFVDQWRQSIRTNMNTKRTDYQSQVNGVLKEIVVEQKLQLRLLEAARRPLEKVQNRQALPRDAGIAPYLSTDGGFKEVEELLPVDGKARIENTAIVDMATSKDSIIDRERWTSLNLQVEAIRKIDEAIDDRLDDVLDTGRWAGSVGRFVNSLSRLLDYPNQPALIDRVVDVIRAFIRQPTVTNFQFNNVLIMGPAGTGKTRLASVIGTIFAQLGMYVYDEFVEASIGDFIAGFVGQTELKVFNFLTKNAEKTVFLDEAYALTLWNEAGSRLEGYSPEAVAQLIAFLSQNVGKIAFIAAGYEDKMRDDFLAANEGFARRLPIVAVLGDYARADLFRIFIRSMALGYVGPEPPESDFGAHDAWENSLNSRIQRCRRFFTDDAIWLLYDVLDESAARKDDVDGDTNQLRSYIRRYFESQAGAMVNLAGVALNLVLSNANTAMLEAGTMKIDRVAMLDILLTAFQNTFVGNETPYDKACEELLELLRRQRWIGSSAGGGGPGGPGGGGGGGGGGGKKRQKDDFIDESAAPTWLAPPKALSGSPPETAPGPPPFQASVSSILRNPTFTARTAEERSIFSGLMDLIDPQFLKDNADLKKEEEKREAGRMQRSQASEDQKARQYAAGSGAGIRSELAIQKAEKKTVDERAARAAERRGPLDPGMEMESTSDRMKRNKQMREEREEKERREREGVPMSQSEYEDEGESVDGSVVSEPAASPPRNGSRRGGRRSVQKQ